MQSLSRYYHAAIMLFSQYFHVIFTLFSRYYLQFSCAPRGDDTTGEARLRSEWNKYVMKDVIAPLYALLLVKACTYLQTLDSFDSGYGSGVSSSRTSGPSISPQITVDSRVNSVSPYSILSLFPCPAPPDYWGSIPTSLFPLLADRRILFCRSHGGCYLSLKQAVILEAHTSLPSFLANHSSGTR